MVHEVLMLARRFEMRPGTAARPGRLPMVVGVAALLALARPNLARATDPAPITQMGAPSLNAASSALLDRATFPALAGIAFEQCMQDGANERALTFDVTPLGVMALFRPGAGSTSPGTRLSGLLGRMAARITLGGPLQFVDSLRAARAGRITDHVTSELKLRWLDREATGDQAPFGLALTLTADNLGTGFGLDRYGAALVADGSSPWTWTLNAGYRIVERYHVPTRSEEAKLGAGAAWGLPWLARAGPLSAELSGACLLRNLHRATTWQGAIRLEAPVGGGLQMALGALYSDRPEMPGDDRSRVVVGLAYGLGGRGSR